MRGRNVEEDELVGAGGVVEPGLLHRVARVHEVDELDALHHAPVVDVETGDDALGEHGAVGGMRGRLAALASGS